MDELNNTTNFVKYLLIFFFILEAKAFLAREGLQLRSAV